MSDTIAQDTTPHPHQEGHQPPANKDSDASGAAGRISSRSPSPQRGKTRDGEFELRHHHHHRHRSDMEGDSDSDDSLYGHRKGRRRRIAESASHLLAQAPAVPDLRFDTNYRKALDQIYMDHDRDTILAHAAASSDNSKLQRQRRVPSIAARITVMTIKDIIIHPFVHGFLWGFGAIFLAMASQRALGYHFRRSLKSLFGGNPDDVPPAIRGEPARARRFGNKGLGGIGLMNAGSASGSRFANRDPMSIN